jgi:hypothetical protein
MLAGTVVYVNAGTQIAQISSPGGILSAKLIGSFVLLGIFPLLAKRIVGMVKARRVYAKWARPARFERNLVVIGAGSAGLVIERSRPKTELDGFEWFCAKCNHLLHRVEIHCADIVANLPPLFDAFDADMARRTCAKCGAVHPGRGF